MTSVPAADRQGGAERSVPVRSRDKVQEVLRGGRAPSLSPAQSSLSPERRTRPPHGECAAPPFRAAGHGSALRVRLADHHRSRCAPLHLTACTDRRIRTKHGGIGLAATSVSVQAGCRWRPHATAAGHEERTRRSVVPGRHRCEGIVAVANGRESQNRGGDRQSASDAPSSRSRRAGRRPKRDLWPFLAERRSGAGRTGVKAGCAPHRIGTVKAPSPARQRPNACSRSGPPRLPRGYDAAHRCA